MDNLCETVLQMCVLVGIHTLCTQLLPSGSMRGMLHMACGWMLLHMMLTNLLAIGGQSAGQSTWAWSEWVMSARGR